MWSYLVRSLSVSYASTACWESVPKIHSTYTIPDKIGWRSRLGLLPHINKIYVQIVAQCRPRIVHRAHIFQKRISGGLLAVTRSPLLRKLCVFCVFLLCVVASLPPDEGQQIPVDYQLTQLTGHKSVGRSRSQGPGEDEIGGKRALSLKNCLLYTSRCV